MTLVEDLLAFLMGFRLLCGLWRSALRALRSLALPGGALLMGQAWGGAVFDGQLLSGPLLPAPEARLRGLEQVSALRPGLCCRGGGSGRTHGKLM